MEEHGEGGNVAVVDCPRVTLHKTLQLLVIVHSTPIGLTGHPVPRLIRKGLIAKRNSQRRFASQSFPSLESARLSMRWRPIAVIPIWRPGNGHWGGLTNGSG